ncbi:MAG TPA: RNA-processing protein [Thermofilum sp.]|nr:RNA-processing protein [Thermofilum sp.]
MKFTIPIPIDRRRLGTLLGNSAKLKREIEETLNVKLIIDSENGVVHVETEEELMPLKVMKLKNIFKAISLGFTLESVRKLLDDSNVLEIVDLKEVARNTRDLQRIKGRIIGEEGKARKMIEDMTGVDLVISEHEVGIIGDYEGVTAAREAVEMLVKGRTHSTVYRFLRVKAREIRRRRMELWEKMGVTSNTINLS